MIVDNLSRHSRKAPDFSNVTVVTIFLAKPAFFFYLDDIFLIAELKCRVVSTQLRYYCGNLSRQSRKAPNISNIKEVVIFLPKQVM